MKTVILAGGLGTRLLEYTETIPKPLVSIGGKPILTHIINIYKKQGFDDFIILLGYKGDKIINYYCKQKNFTCQHKSKNKNIFYNKLLKFKITLINTGLNSKTGLRLYKIKKEFKKNENFLLTYGDGLANINLKKLINFHLSRKSSLTISAVRPPARFGEIKFVGNKVKSFEEKNSINSGWINGGFMVANENFFRYLSSKNQMLEREPFQKCLEQYNFHAYKHSDFWLCMDNLRDKKLLDKMAKSKSPPWTK